MKNKKTIYTEPWIGEFGWELFCWQGFLRRLAEKTGDKFVITCRTGHELLYQDFASEIKTYDPKFEETDMWMNHGEIIDIPFHNRNKILNNTYSQFWWYDEHWSQRQSFIKYGNKNYKKFPAYDVLLILRDTNKCNTGFRNWPGDNALEVAHQLTLKGYSVACVGKNNSALSIYGYYQYLDIPLSELADLMNNAKVLVGPQCGVTHFATLCGLPQITWQTKQEHADRVAYKWNPFKVPTVTIPSHDSYWRQRRLWTPLAIDLVNTIETFLNSKEMRNR